MDESPELDPLCSFHLLLDDVYATSPTPDWLVSLRNTICPFSTGSIMENIAYLVYQVSSLSLSGDCNALWHNGDKCDEEDGNTGKTTMKHRHAIGTAGLPSRIDSCEFTLRPISSKTSKRRPHESTSDYKYIISYMYLIAGLLPPTMLNCRVVYQAKRSLGDFRFLPWRNSRRYYAYNPQRVLQPTVVADRQGRKSVPLTGDARDFHCTFLACRESRILINNLLTPSVPCLFVSHQVSWLTRSPDHQIEHS
jgi:hypothetical protein